MTSLGPGLHGCTNGPCECAMARIDALNTFALKKFKSGLHAK
jgi:hypothetical protein